MTLKDSHFERVDCAKYHNPVCRAFPIQRLLANSPFLWLPIFTSYRPLTYSSSLLVMSFMSFHFFTILSLVFVCVHASFSLDTYLGRAQDCLLCYSSHSGLAQSCADQTLQCVKKKNPSFYSPILAIFKKHIPEYTPSVRMLQNKIKPVSARLYEKNVARNGPVLNDFVNVFYANRPVPQNISLYCQGFSVLFMSAEDATVDCDVDIGHVLQVTSAGIGTLLAEYVVRVPQFSFISAFSGVVDGYVTDPDYKYASLLSKREKRRLQEKKKNALNSGSRYAKTQNSTLETIGRWRSDTAAKIIVWSRKRKRTEIVRKAMGKLRNNGFSEKSFLRNKEKYSVKRTGSDPNNRKNKRYVVMAPFSAIFLLQFP